MKRVIVLVICMMITGEMLSQQFQQQFDLPLPDSVVSTRPAWVDLDNDGLLDILLLSATRSNKNYLQLIKGDTVNQPVLSDQSISTLSVSAFSLADYNGDNKMDVIVSGLRNNVPATAVYINQGAFSFEEHVLNVPPFSIMKLADLDNDARNEWIISNEANSLSYVKILKQYDSFSWTVYDSIAVNATALEILDANGDGRMDIFVSGKASADSLTSGFLMNSGGLYFKPKTLSSTIGMSSSADMNNDGIFDVLLTGHKVNNSLTAELFESNGGGYTVKNEPILLRDAHPFLADFNSDGAVDISFLGTLPSDDTLNIIQYDAQDYDTLYTRNLVSRHFGDTEHDGDLDVLEMLQSDVIHLVLYKNTPVQKNNAPSAPKNAVAVTIFNRLFMYWDKSADDHTPVSSITYDVYLDGSDGLQAGEFDLLNDRRLTVSHGNNGTENFRLLAGIPSGPLGFAIQAVDNAFHAGAQCLGNAMPCVDMTQETLSLCSSEEVSLTSPTDALWFSFSGGFLGGGGEFTLHASDQDTVFYFSPSTSGCDGLKAWTVEVKDDTVKTEMLERFACEGSEIHLRVETGWQNVKWLSQLRGDLGSDIDIAYTVTQPDTVIATISNDDGCAILRKTAVEISKPRLSLTGDQYKIVKGSSVQLGATGAQRYEWTPSNGLNKADVANPVATPEISIEYTVTGYDSLNCTDKALVNIIVEGTGFVPNLFTPNEDGKNDQLRIYGLPAAKDFTFTVYNREGSIVFKTSDVSEAVRQGWDGTKNGTKQPAGVYFWKVKGELASGEVILLNGKSSGSIVLVR